MLKDHLGNVRATLTDEWQQDNYPAATMETGSRSTENTFYTRLDDTYTPVSSIANYPAGSSASQPNAAVAKLNKQTQPVGPGILLKVMAGDRFDVSASSWDNSRSGNGWGEGCFDKNQSVLCNDPSGVC